MATFNFFLYLLAVLTCLACTVLLFRGYAASGLQLLLWSALCFVGFSLSNVLLFFDLVLFPTQVDLRPWRLLTALAGCSSCSTASSSNRSSHDRVPFRRGHSRLPALNRLLAHALTVVIEPASLVYVLRILDFGLIIGAIVDKNVQKPLARTQRRAR